MKQYFSFQWHITDECDQRCKHCYIFSEDNCKNLDSMTWRQMQDTFYNCLDFCKIYDRLPYFYITGGDPILHPDFWKLLELMKQHDIPFTILGNPFHLNDEVCRRLKEYGCQKYQLLLTECGKPTTGSASRAASTLPWRKSAASTVRVSAA